MENENIMKEMSLKEALEKKILYYTEHGAIAAINSYGKFEMTEEEKKEALESLSKKEGKEIFLKNGKIASFYVSSTQLIGHGLREDTAMVGLPLIFSKDNIPSKVFGNIKRYASCSSCY